MAVIDEGDDAVREDQPVAAGGERLRARSGRAASTEPSSGNPLNAVFAASSSTSGGRRLDDEERDRVVAERRRRDLRDEAALRDRRRRRSRRSRTNSVQSM